MARRCAGLAAGIGARDAPARTPWQAWAKRAQAGRLSPTSAFHKRQQAAMEVVGAAMIAGRDRVPERDARPRRGARDRRDRAMGAEREGRVEQRVDRAEDAARRRCHHHEIGHELEIAGALLDPDHRRHLGHDPHQERRREVGPGHHVVDDHRQPGLRRDRAEMLEHRVVIGAEQVMHRRHLQRGDAEVAHQPPAPDRLARRNRR